MKNTNFLSKLQCIISFISLLLLISPSLFSQNVGINVTGITPSQNAILDLNTGNAKNLGLLIPRVVLGASLSTFNPPMAYAATGKDSGMMVFNWQATNQSIGYYYWNGSTWVNVSGGGGVSGSGTINYLARWTPNSTTLGIGVTQDNGTSVGINNTPVGSQMLTVTQTNAANTAIMGQNTAAAGTNNGVGVYGISSQAYAAGPLNGYGVVAINNNSSGTGFYAAGNNLGYNYINVSTGAGATMAGAYAGVGYSPYNNGIGFWGYNTGTSGLGVYGYATGATSTGVFGVGDNAAGITFTNGSGGAFTGTVLGSFSYATSGSGVGVIGEGNGLGGSTSPAAGSGGAFTGNTIGDFGFATTASSGNGMVGVGNNGSYYTSPIGAGGAFTGSAAGGGLGMGLYASTTGTAASGSYFNLNEGVMAAGTYGVIGYGASWGSYFQNTAGSGQTYIAGSGYGITAYGSNYGGYFQNSAATNWSYLGGGGYEIIGGGTKSCEVLDDQGQYRVLHCPEAPDVLFEDFGSATLSNGKVHVDLDPLYAKNVTINEKHPLRVIITLNDQCNGVYVTNRTPKGFDVVELNSGTSNASFTYEVVANRAPVYNAEHQIVFNYADMRFEIGPGPMKQTVPKVESANYETGKMENNKPISPSIQQSLVTQQAGK